MLPDPDSSQATTKPPISRSSVTRSIARFSRNAVRASLPGFSELGEVAKALAEDWKAADHNDDEVSELISRVKGIYSLMCEFDTTDHPDISDASRRLDQIQDLLAKELKHQSRSGILGAEQRQRLLGSLRLEIDRIVEITHLRLALVQAQPNPLDNFQVISAHEIANRSVAYECYLYPESEGTHGLTLDERRHSFVGARAWRGQLGKAAVIYRTYYSRSKSGVAAKVAEKELKYLSKCLHPNVVSVIGITKGYDGLNGYAVATSGIPLAQFILRVNSGASLVKCIQGLECARVAAEEIFYSYAIEADEVTVQPDGHLTALPIRIPGPARCSPQLSPDDYSTSNSASALMLEIYANIYPGSLSNCSVLLGEVAALGRQTFTALEIARLAAKHKLLPRERRYLWNAGSAPPFTIKAGDIIYIPKQSQESFWTAGKRGQMEFADDITGHNYECECDRNRDQRSHTESGQWMSVILCSCCGNRPGWPRVMVKASPVEISYERARQERAFLRNCGMEVEGAQFCTFMGYYVFLRYVGPIKLPPQLLYFHRNPTMHTNPRAFWGFLSTSADPCSPGIDPAEEGPQLAYLCEFSIVCLSDFWDYKYEKMLQSGLASMPGGYPGSYIEEVSEDETG